VNQALLSRCAVIELESLGEEALATVIARGAAELGAEVPDDARAELIARAGGDGRGALQTLELAVWTARAEGVPLAPRHVEDAARKRPLRYDRAGDRHYDLASALIKSMRGGDPDAAVYYLAAMLEAGEDPRFLARRVVIAASEDVGNADPQALSIAMAAMEAFRFLGHPEGELALAQAAVYLATAPKSNSIYTAYGSAQGAAVQGGSLPVPLHIRNAPTKLMHELGYGQGYRYAHDYRDAFAPQDYLPEELKGQVFYHPTDRGYERTVAERLARWRDLRARRRPKHPPEPGDTG
jgi:putative ATPase